MPTLNFEFDIFLRLLGATAIGLAIGFNRDLRNKSIGMRTLSLVSLGTVVVAVAALEYGGLADHPDSLSRVVQGLVQGILTGVGFIGAGVILHDERRGKVQGLTTAATVWITAALALACALAAWWLVLMGTAIALGVLIGLRQIEKKYLRLR